MSTIKISSTSASVPLVNTKNFKKPFVTCTSGETIISFLKEVDGSLTQKQYEAIAWQGLQGTTAWKKMTANEIADIQNTYDMWENATPNYCN